MAPARQMEPIGNRFGRVAKVREGTVEIVHDVDEREEHIAPSGLASAGEVLPRAPAIVVEIGGETQTSLALDGELSIESLDLLLGR